MRAPANPSCTPQNNNKTSISQTTTLHVELRLTLSTCITPRHKPIQLPNGVIATKPLYHTCTAQPEFVPHRPAFEAPRSSRDARVEEGTGTVGEKEKKEKQWGRHAALVAHLSVELREDGGSWGRVVRACERGRDR